MQDGNDELLTWVPRLRRYARALTGSRDDADDLVQDTLERAWTKSGSWRSVTDMRAWLFGIMHNLHVDGVRRPGLHTVTLDDETPEVPVAPTQGDRLAVLNLQTALEKLSVEQREILLLVALEDMSYAEIATTLRIPIGSVMSRLSRGRERLRALLEGRPETVRLKAVT
ncbi:MAG: RNA polymerase sigma factor [Polaromonas sp.]